MLFKLSIRNILRSIKDYAIYFFTLILGVVIFYVFNAIGTQSSMMQLSSSSREVVKLLITVLSGVSVLVAGILGYLIIYASRFLIRRRNKEFAIYLTLGMSKQKISLLLFLETLFIGIFSLVSGLVIGVFLSQLMSVLVASLFEADMSKFQFVFSSEACLKTILYFGIIYFIVIIFNTFMVNKLKIIDLIQSSRKSEKTRLKNPIICSVIFLIAAVALGFAYFEVTTSYMKILSNANLLFLYFAIGTISTFFIFWSLSGLIMRLVTIRKKLYYHGLNSFTFRQISSKINTTVASMTVICIMLFLTICMLSSCLSIREATKKQLAYATPVDVIIKYDNHKSFEHELEDEQGSDDGQGSSNNHSDRSGKVDNQSKKSTKKKPEQPQALKDMDQKEKVEDIIKENPNIWSQLKDQQSVSTYNLSNTFEKRFRLSQVISSNAIKKFNEITQRTGDSSYASLNVLSLTDYNKLAKLYHLDQIEMAEDQYFILADFSKLYPIYNTSLKEGFQIKMNNRALSPKFDHVVEGALEPTSPKSNFGIIVVSDDMVKGLVQQDNYLIANYKVHSRKDREQLDQALQKMIAGNTNDYIRVTEKRLYTLKTKNYIISLSVGLQAIATFLGLYLGVIFLISSAAILALKELSESSDNREKYMVLRRLGADEKMIKQALFRQIAIFFSTPLLLAIIHSVFGLTFALNILSYIGTDGLLSSIIMTVVLLIIIYGGYFLITYFSSKRIISEKQLRRS